jgi:hypothetical protein
MVIKNTLHHNPEWGFLIFSCFCICIALLGNPFGVCVMQFVTNPWIASMVSEGKPLRGWGCEIEETFFAANKYYGALHL